MPEIRYEFDQIAPVYKENEAFMLMRNLKDSFYAHQSKPFTCDPDIGHQKKN